MGSLHIWEGNVTPVGYKYTWRVNGKWANVYVQEGSEMIEDIKGHLSEDDRENLEQGYCVTVQLPSYYFQTY